MRSPKVIKPTLNTTKIESPKPATLRGGDREILIAVMGVTGSGKSYFCRAATGDDDIEVGDGLESCNASDTPL
jgi:ABC-type lipoprotein export system ATPase subunit